MARAPCRISDNAQGRVAALEGAWDRCRSHREPARRAETPEPAVQRSETREARCSRKACANHRPVRSLLYSVVSAQSSKSPQKSRLTVTAAAPADAAASTPRERPALTGAAR